jgi:hypothetical protein
MSEQENDSDKSDDVPASALPRELTKRVASKLADLQARKADILKKMQRLRYLADNLAGRRRTAQPEPALTEQSSSVEARRPRAGNGKLRRACRIALMETDGAQSSSQIYDRIQKRGSACFEEYRDPMGSLVDELESMVRKGEVLCSHAEQGNLWKLKRG